MVKSGVEAISQIDDKFQQFHKQKTKEKGRREDLRKTIFHSRLKKNQILLMHFFYSSRFVYVYQCFFSQSSLVRRDLTNSFLGSLKML